MSLARALAAKAAALLVALHLLGASGCIYAPLDLGLGEIGKVQEVTLVEAASPAKILMLRIDGEISDSGESGFFGTSEGTTAQVKDLLDLSLGDDAVKALIVRIDSPGGGVTASDIIYREILDWKKATGKPVVALFMDTAASGGYYAAMAADKIVAHPTSICGSIGVIAMLPNVSGLAEKLGVTVHTVKSGANKDLGSPFRPMTAEDLKTFQTLIDQMYERFVDVVAEGRKGKITRDGVKKIADGRVYTSAEAKRLNMIDQIGYTADAIAVAKGLANVKDASVVTYERKGFGAGRRTIYSRSQGDPVAASVLSRAAGQGDVNAVKVDLGGLLPSSRPRLSYLWMPGAQ